VREPEARPANEADALKQTVGQVEDEARTSLHMVLRVLGNIISTVSGTV
jgi:hypothetical protein